MPIYAPKVGKKRTVAYRNARGQTRSAVVKGAGTNSGLKLRVGSYNNTVLDDVAIQTTLKGTSKYIHR